MTLINSYQAAIRLGISPRHLGRLKIPVAFQSKHGRYYDDDVVTAIANERWERLGPSPRRPKNVQSDG